MPRSSSLTSISTYFLYRVGSAASGLTTRWISISTNRYRGITGTFSDTSVGQLITIGANSNTTAGLTNTTRIINRHKSNGNIYWAVNYPANTYMFASEVSVERYETLTKDTPDSSQNVYIGVTHSSSSSATNPRVNVVKLTPSGSVSFQRQISATTGSFSLMDLKSDYLGSTIIGTGNIIRLNANGSTVYQKQYNIPIGHDFSFVRGCESFEDYSWFTADSRQFSNTFYSQVFSLSSNGNVLWKNQLGIGIGKNLISESLCVDSDKNVYLVGRENNTTSSSGFVIKLSNTGSLSWAKSFSNTNFLDVVYSKKDDAIYSSGRDTRNSEVGVISKLYSNGEIDYTRTIHPTDGQKPSIFPDREGYIHVTNKDFTIRLNSDGSDTNTYISVGIVYSNVNSSNVLVSNILSSITNTVSGATLTDSSLTITTPTITPTNINFTDLIAPLDIQSQIYTTSGSFDWVVPDGVTSISVVCVGGGGGGGAGYSAVSISGGGGGGGGLSYRNNISVTPGETLTVIVGSGGTSAIRSAGGNGGTSGLQRSGSYLVHATGGSGGSYTGTFNVFGAAGQGGTSLNANYSGGNGGIGGGGGTLGGGGGGAGGYSGHGGSGGYNNGAGTTFGAVSGTGGGGGGGTAINLGTNVSSGGGVDVLGQGVNGAGDGAQPDPGGIGGSSGTAGTRSSGGTYGGGGGGAYRVGNDLAGAAGGTGVVRIIWPGTTKQFPKISVS
jgi:hypothetical protein